MDLTEALETNPDEMLAVASNSCSRWVPVFASHGGGSARAAVVREDSALALNAHYHDRLVRDAAIRAARGAHWYLCPYVILPVVACCHWLRKAMSWP